ncbi:MAG: hypothetical protein NPINA01_13340 [Nitrospinaceae bacterium]|nr:MAG: hypothetical protein NPINA01_13340 [Nitrospinaceae bacterium]
MSEEIVLPELGDGIESADVVSVSVSEGDEVEKDSTVFELETEKAVFDFPSPQSGRITEIRIKVGDTIKVGQVLFTLDSKENKEDNKKPEGDSKKQVSRRESSKAESKKQEPEKKESSKKDKEGGEKKSIPDQEQDSKKEIKTDEPPPMHAEEDQAGDTIPAGPATRKLARELGVKLSAVEGSARGGRITLEDVKSYVKNHLRSAQVAGKAPVKELPDFSQWGPVERKPLSSLRRKVAENLSAAWSSVPLVTQFDEADITELEKMRKKNSAYVTERGGKLTITVFILKAVVASLKAFPQFNASLDLKTGELIYKKYFNVGVAVDTPSGLIVPVIKNVDGKSFTELAIELSELSKRARDRKVSLEELRGGNISISNLGGIGGTGFTPLVNPPDVAVVGLSRSRVSPVWKNETLEPRLIMPFSVSYDHRVIDGADGVRFSRSIAHELETFQELLLEG